MDRKNPPIEIVGLEASLQDAARPKARPAPAPKQAPKRPDPVKRATAAPTGATPRSSDGAPQEPRLLSSADVCSLLRVSKRTVSRWARAGCLPRPLLLGGLRRWRLADITRWVEAMAEGARERR